jgi:GNAT superfamily N-acetyltransferase
MLRSKTHWDYDAAFIEACREDLTIDADWLQRHDGFVAEQNDTVVGFFGISHEDGTARVEHFFVARDAIGSGVGGVMWTEYLRLATLRGAHRIEIESEPFARPFYERMGAVQIGEIPSTVFAGRLLPLMEIKLVP